MHQPPTRLLLPLLAALLLAAPALAQDGGADGGEPSDAERYAQCLDLARSEPEAAVERARTWRDTGGGDPARHCEAMATMALGHYQQAGKMLEELAQRMDQGHGAAIRSRALLQAGRAWMLADQPARSEAVLTQAIDLDRENVELWIDRAFARFQLGNDWEAIDDLNRAQELAPKRPDIYVYRARGYRYVDSPEMARENIGRALELAPDSPMVLLESGTLHRLQGNEEAARQAWMRVIEAAPDSTMADAARDKLEDMDVQVEDGPGGG